MKRNHYSVSGTRNSQVRGRASFRNLLKYISSLTVICLLAAGVFISGAQAEENGLKRLSGKYISVMGDSISTYAGWSDSQPITGEECTYRYGEAYYGPEGGDYHNTDMLVGDTWWHQAAEELGAEILVSNAGNSTGLLHASYPANAGWEQYLKEMLAYKTRPYYLGTADKDPDVIALYIGSSDMGKEKIDNFGTVEDVDFDALIQQDEAGSYIYAEPKTVAEAYCIMLHKIQVTYPDAEIYCFTTVPNAGGYLNTCNNRLKSTVPFNEMVKGVAEYHGAYVVDIYDEFNLDPDGDGEAVQEDWDTFKTYFHNDPHPNASGFDVITRRFVETVLANTKYEAPEEKPQPDGGNDNIPEMPAPQPTVAPTMPPAADIPETGDDYSILYSVVICGFAAFSLLAFSVFSRKNGYTKPESKENL